MKFDFASRTAKMNGTATREIFKLLSRPEIVSFAGGLPANECLPLEQVREIAAEILASDFRSYLQYGTTEGFPALREQLAAYIRARGITGFREENVMTLSGGQQGIDLVFKAFIEKGDVVLVEDPTYLAVLSILDTYEGRAVGVRSCDTGLDIDDLEAKIKMHKPKILYVVPTFSNPTGRTYTAENRKAVAALTARYGVLVVEDDPYSLLRFAGDPVPPLKCFDTTGNVLYITSFSKIISPGLRVGAAVGAPEVIRYMVVGKQGTDLHTSNLSQMIVAEYLRKEYLFPNIEKSLPIYRTRKQAMMQAIAKYMPEEFAHTDPDGGLFIWGELPPEIDTVQLLPEAIARNVAYIQGQVFYADGGGRNTVRLNYSNARPEQIERGIQALGGLFKETLAK